MIQIKNLSKSFYDKKVFSNLNYDFQYGKLYVLRGSNGCGKTTLLNIMSGEDSAYEGGVLFNGKEITDKNRSFFHEEYISYFHQEPFVFDDLSVIDNIFVPYSDKDYNKAYSLLKYVGLEGKETQNASLLSSGEKQRLSIARGLYCDEPVLFFDEVTSFLDSQNAKNIFDLIFDLSKNHLIIMISHDELPQDLNNRCEIIDLDKSGLNCISKNHDTSSESAFELQSYVKTPDCNRTLDSFKKGYKENKFFYQILSISKLVFSFLILFFGCLGFTYDTENKNNITFDNFINSAEGFLINDKTDKNSFEKGSVFNMKSDSVYQISNKSRKDKDTIIGEHFAGIFNLEGGLSYEIAGFEIKKDASGISLGDYPSSNYQIMISDVCYNFLLEDTQQTFSLSAADAKEKLFAPNGISMNSQKFTLKGVYDTDEISYSPQGIKSNYNMTRICYSFLKESVFEFSEGSIDSYGTMVRSTKNNITKVMKTDLAYNLLSYSYFSGDSINAGEVVSYTNVDDNGNFILGWMEDFQIMHISLMYVFIVLDIIISIVLSIAFYQANKRKYLLLRLSGTNRQMLLKRDLITGTVFSGAGMVSGLVFGVLGGLILDAYYKGKIVFSSATYFVIGSIPVLCPILIFGFTLGFFSLEILKFLLPKDISKMIKEAKRK